MKLTLLATLALSALASALPPDYEYRPFAVPKPKINPHVDLRVLRDMCLLLSTKGPDETPHLDMDPGTCVSFVKPLFGYL